jgi:DNA-binding IclR family transcriptional regulator
MSDPEPVHTFPKLPRKSEAALPFAAGPRLHKPSRYSVPAIDKALDVLEALADDSVPQSLTALSRKLKRTSSELFRVFDSLLQRGYVIRDDLSGSYSLSLKLYELSHVHSPVDRLLKAAELPMHQLAVQVRESCHLSILNDGKLLVLAQAESPEPLRLSVEVGRAFSALRSTSGRLLLAMLPPATLEELLAHEPDWPAMTKRNRTKLQSELRAIGQDGYYVADSQTRPGMKDIAVIVGSRRAGFVGTLCIPCLLGGRDQEGIRLLLGALQEIAEKINRTLGIGAGTAAEGTK